MNVPRWVAAAALFLCLLPCAAQTRPPSDSTQTSPAPNGALFVSPAERRFFALGLLLSQAAFAPAKLTRQASVLSHVHNFKAKMDGFAALAPAALAARDTARDALTRAALLLPDMDAPESVSAPAARLSVQLAKPLLVTGDAAAVAPLNADAARALAVLGEARQLSDVLNLPALKTWLKSPDVDKNGPVWYAEGVLAGIAEVADAQGLPGLLPPAPELATDLRGLRDWLSGRLPETPTPEQSALQDALSGFLQDAADKKHAPTFSVAELRALGDISRRLQAQMLPPQTVAAQG